MKNADGSNLERTYVRIVNIVSIVLKHPCCHNQCWSSFLNLINNDMTEDRRREAGYGPRYNMAKTNRRVRSHMCGSCKMSLQ